MSIVSSDLVCYCAASRPEDDASTSGGAIDTASQPALTQFGTSAKVAVISDGTDTRSVTIEGRDAGGAIQTESVTLNGTSEVLSTNTYSRVLSIVLGSSSGTRTVLVKEGSGGTVRGTLAPNITGLYIMFRKSASAGTTQVRYEKLFWQNNNGSLSLTSAQMTLTTDAASDIQIGCDVALNSSASVANRLTAPSSVVFVGDNVAQGIPSSGVLAAASKVGVWIQETLAANASALTSTFTTQLAGQTV